MTIISWILWFLNFNNESELFHDNNGDYRDDNDYKHIMVISIMIMNMIMVMMSLPQEITSAIFDSIDVKSLM